MIKDVIKREKTCSALLKQKTFRDFFKSKGLKIAADITAWVLIANAG